MLKTFQRFFAFCSPKNRKKFYLSIVLGVFSALFGALKIPAIGVLLQAVLAGDIPDSAIWASLGIMVVSIAGASLINYRSTMLQTEAGYGTAAEKRMEIAEHMRYLPMGYFNANSLGQIISTTTNTMEALSDVGTRVVMLVTGGIFLTGAVTFMLFFFDWRIGLLVLVGLALFALVNMAMQRAAQACSEEKVRSDAALVEQVLEYIKGIAEVKSYHLSGSYNRKLEAAIDENQAANTDMELTLVPYMALQNLVAKLIGAAMCAASLLFCIGGSLSRFHCIMLMICSFVMLEGLERAGNYSALLRVVDLSVRKATDILDLPAMDIEGVDEAPASFDLKADHIRFS